MIDNSTENDVRSSSGQIVITVLNRFAAGFVAMMNNMYDVAKQRLPQSNGDEEAELEASSKKRSAYQGLEDDWSLEHNEGYRSGSYRGSEHFHHLYH
ncbi:hypothetical protein [Labrenzia sp. DG1229]|uniref:hypothetical protein n=1 Tax=Labrenzia sp. DG1229 TaxID=681847 RepID=UPI000B16575E|nr:hypothetical protein [Labrenzia sp. DG1229]